VTEPLTCLACRAGQVQRGEPLCLPCTVAAGEVAPCPAWVLDSPLLRRALADANVPAALAIVRAACGLSQQDMADLAGWSRAAQSYYERGRREAVYDVRVLLQFADAAGMPRGYLLALVLEDPDAAANGAVGQAGANPGTSAPGATGARARYWRACTDALYERGRQAGNEAMLGPSLRLWRQARAACTAPAGRPDADLLATAAGAGLYAARAALDCGNLTVARQLRETSAELASGTRDPMLSVHVLLSGSRLRAETARSRGSREPARQALHLARQAAEEARYLPVPELHALIATGQATAAALLGDQPSFATAISRARRDLGRVRPVASQSLPAWLRHFGASDVDAAEAEGMAVLAGPSARADLAATTA
jgi:transcriptional regulator with XRE-family HTH domain